MNILPVTVIVFGLFVFQSVVPIPTGSYQHFQQQSGSASVNDIDGLANTLVKGIAKALSNGDLNELKKYLSDDCFFVDCHNFTTADRCYNILKQIPPNVKIEAKVSNAHEDDDQVFINFTLFSTGSGGIYPAQEGVVFDEKRKKMISWKMIECEEIGWHKEEYEEYEENPDLD